MKRGHHYGKTLTVHRKGYLRKSYVNKDRGNPGKGPRLIHINKKDDMNKIAREMGYESATFVPDMHMDSFIRRPRRESLPRCSRTEMPAREGR